MKSPPPSLAALLATPHPPASDWSDESQIPWNDPDFSEMMLKVHLDQSTHMASRKLEVIDAHVDWLVRLLNERFAGVERLSVLDAGCGPGLYGHELARRGISSVGVDFAPAPLRHARRIAEDEQLDCIFVTADLKDLPRDLAVAHGPFHAVTIWFCEFHSFRFDVIPAILRNLSRYLVPGGLLVIEYLPWDDFGKDDRTSWSVQQTSALCPRPHLWLQELGWDDERRVETHVHWIIETGTGDVRRYVQRQQAYRPEDLMQLLIEADLQDPVFYPPITDRAEGFEFPLVVVKKV